MVKEDMKMLLELLEEAFISCDEESCNDCDYLVNLVVGELPQCPITIVRDMISQRLLRGRR